MGFAGRRPDRKDHGGAIPQYVEIMIFISNGKDREKGKISAYSNGPGEGF